MASTTSFGDWNKGLQVGHNSGSITTVFYLLPRTLSSARLGFANGASPKERPETPPDSLSTVPFRSDPDFTNHGTLLDLIYKKKSTPASRIALIGLGGIGYVNNRT